MLLSVAARIRSATGKFAVAQRLEGHRDLLAALLVVGLGARSAGGSAFVWRALEESHHQ